MSLHRVTSLRSAAHNHAKRVLRGFSSSRRAEYIDFDEKLRKAQGKRAGSEKSEPRLDTDGPPSIGRLGPLQRKNRPTLTNSVLKGVIFDLSCLLNFFPAGNGDEAMKPELVSDSRWNVGNGARDTLMWVESRGLKTSILPRLFLSKDASHLLNFTLGSFQERLGHDFEQVMDNIPLSNETDKIEWALLEESQRMGIEAKEVMVVTLSPMIVGCAKKAHMHTTALKGNRNGPALRQADFKIATLGELRSKIEELNGISYRKDS